MVDVRVAPVRYEMLLRAVEKADALGHVVQHRSEQLAADLYFVVHLG